MSGTTVSYFPVLSNLCTTYVPSLPWKFGGPGQDVGGLCPPGPNIEPPLNQTAYLPVVVALYSIIIMLLPAVWYKWNYTL